MNFSAIGQMRFNFERYVEVSCCCQTVPRECVIKKRFTVFDLDVFKCCQAAQIFHTANHAGRRACRRRRGAARCLCVSFRSHKKLACCTVDGGICRFCSRGTAWPYSVNGTDCYCGRLQRNVKIARAVDDATGARPTGFMAVSGDTKVLIPGDHKVGSQSKHCGVSPVHKTQSASFFFTQEAWFPDLANESG